MKLSADVWRRALLFAVNIVAFCSLAHAQESLHFEHLAVEDGLTGNQITDLAQDRVGFVWIATSNGLNRFDGQSIRSYSHDSRIPGSLPHNDVRAITVDENGRLWVGTRGGGLARYEIDTDQFTIFRATPDNPRALHSDFIEALAADGHGGLWFGTRGDGVGYLDLATERFDRYDKDAAAPGALRGGRIGAILVTSDATVWVGGVGHGLYRFEGRAKGFRQFLPVDSDPSSLPDRRVNALHQDGTGRLWVGTGGGLALWEPASQMFRRWQSDEGGVGLASNQVKDVVDASDGGLWLSLPGVGLQHFDAVRGPGLVQRPQPTRRNSLADAGTNRLMIDRTGVLWVGTSLGVDRLDPATRAFTAYHADVDHPERFPDDNLWGIGQTADGAIWLATAGAGVVRFDPMAGTWKNWRNDPKRPDSLASDQIYCLLVDSADRVWVGTADAGLDLYDPGRDAWIHHRHDQSNPATISQDLVYCLREASGGGLWVGLNHGFDRLDPATGVFSHPAVIEGDPDGGMMATVFDIVEDSGGTVWIGTFLNGLYSLQPRTGVWGKYRPEPENHQSLSSYRINVLMVDRTGTVWAGTDLGLFQHLGEGNHWREFGRKQGLSTENIASLKQDAEGRIWVGTSNGLNRLTPETGEIRTFLAEDGLPHQEMGWHGLATMRDGRLAIATARGFALLDRTALKRDPVPPQVTLTGIELFNRRVPLAHEVTGDLPPDMLTLERSIAVTSSITLNHRQNVISFEFAGMHFARPDLIRYAYQLEGWDQGWLETGASRRVATYTNLPGGRYTFRVRAANRDGVWSEPTAGLTVVVKPPPWKSPLALLFYVLLAVGLIAGVIRSLHQRAEAHRLRAEHEASVSERLRRVDVLRDEFLANTSHELRTPLHGMIGIAESLVDGAAGQLTQVANQNLSLIVSSGRRLASLVNDILDFSTLRNDTLALSRKAVDLRPLVDIVLTLSQPLVAGKPVELVNRVSRDIPMADADEGRVQQILHNLVGNAIKFTVQGQITVDARSEGGQLIVSVADTGIGIAEADQERIFESFQQAVGDATREHGGTGLGLAIARQLVGLHGGVLSVESTPGQGSTFRFTLPVASPGALEHVAIGPTIAPLAAERADVVSPVTVRPATSASDGSTILVVDDDPVNRQVLVNQLSLHDYRVVEAVDGEEALRLVEEARPDLILLDVMMPRMSGYDVCRMLRENLTPAQMPVIYLTARSQVVDVVTGFESGANDFLTKPVARNELLVRVRNQLELLDATRNLERKVAERTEQLHLANEELQRIASLDGLTRIPNRRSFDAALERLWADHLRRGDILGMVLFDIDYFKRYNDHYGHQRGDEALIAVATAAAGALRRPTDLAARYGGEEFVALLSGTDREGAIAIAQSILDAVRDLRLEHAASEVSDRVTVSLGVVSLVPTAELAAATMIERSDRALYVAKRSGRNRFAVDESVDD